MGGYMKIEVIESIGKRAYKSLFGNVLEALKTCGLNGKVVMVKDMKTILRYGVKAAPALIINGMVVFAGKTLPTEEIVKLLQQNINPFT
jgi:cyclopropane fatty-acyl-phospholipid synthase-like methyltransferase